MCLTRPKPIGSGVNRRTFGLDEVPRRMIIIGIITFDLRLGVPHLIGVEGSGRQVVIGTFGLIDNSNFDYLNALYLSRRDQGRSAIQIIPRYVPQHISPGPSE